MIAHQNELVVQYWGCTYRSRIVSLSTTHQRGVILFARHIFCVCHEGILFCSEARVAEQVEENEDPTIGDGFPCAG